MIFGRSATAMPDNAVVRRRIAAIGVVLAAYLARQRIIWAVAHAPPGDGMQRLRAVAVAPYEDLLYVVVLVAGFTAASWLARRAPRRLRISWGLYLAAVVFSVVASIVNPIAIEQLRQPISYQWLYYSDFLLSLDAFNAMHSRLNRTLIRRMLLRSAFVVIAGLLLARALTPLLARPKLRRGLLISTAVALGAYVLVVGRWLQASAIEHPYRANPVASSWPRSPALANRGVSLRSPPRSARRTSCRRRTALPDLRPRPRLRRFAT